MARIKRPGLKAPSHFRSSDSTRSGLSRARSTRSSMSKSGHGMGRSTRSGMSVGGSTVNHDDDWDDNQSGHTNPLQRTGQSMRNFLKSANSSGSGMGLSAKGLSAKGLSGKSDHSGDKQKSFKLSHKQKKARPGLAVAPQGMSTRSGMSSSRGLSSRGGMSTRGMSTRSGLSGGSGHRSKRNLSTHSPNGGGSVGKKQMSMRSLGSGHSGHGSGGGSGRGLQAKSTRSMQSGSRSAPEPPAEEYDDDEEYDEFAEYGEEEEEEEEFVLPQTEEEIRKGLHTEQVTKGIFRKKVRSIKWYSADIDKIDAGNFEEKENSDDEYETESDDDSETPVIPDPWYVALGRGLLLLEKKGEEVTPIKRWVRCMTWTTFICEATAAIVVLIQFQGVESCCGRPILNLGSIDVNWPAIIRYFTIMYLLLICLELYPVMRRGFPFNIVNPLIAFLISFALFFDDSYVEALCMWVIETVAVLSEFAIYRLKIRQVNVRAVEIKKLMPKTTKKKEEFEDEDNYLKDLHKARRRYYVLKQEQRMDQRLLQYLHVAVYMNIVLSSIVLMLILVIARNGGLCIVDFDYPNPFSSNQLSRCHLITDPQYGCTNIDEDGCQVCLPETEEYQCYFPYS